MPAPKAPWSKDGSLDMVDRRWTQQTSQANLKRKSHRDT